jgi:MoaA/NifB/PqqE/SkfB family radical SAM enzyme
MIIDIKNNQPAEMLRIEYMPSNVCNYKCNYCFPGSNEGDKLWPDINIVKKNLGHLLTYYSSYGKTKSNIFIAGGEPTLWKDLENLCSYLKTNFNITIEISSNGFRKSEWWKKNAKNFDHVTISVHNDYVNLDHIIEVCDTLYTEDTFVNADVLIDPKNYDQCLKNVEYLKNSKYSWPIISKIVIFNGKHKYTEDQLKYFQNKIKRYPPEEWYKKTIKKVSREIIITNDNNEVFLINDDSWLTRSRQNYFKGWECNLGVDFIKIYPDGKISGNCEQVLFKNNFHYNLYDFNFIKNFTPEIKPVICSKNICSCLEEIVCNKRKIND